MREIEFYLRRSTLGDLRIWMNRGSERNEAATKYRENQS